MSTTRQTLIDISHPLFREGYRLGRQYYFQVHTIVTDKDLMESLLLAFKEEEEGDKQEANLYHLVGQFVGQMSGCVIARQAHEDTMQDAEETFLVKVKQRYGATGQALIETIRQLWTMQDQLALTLDAETFEQMLNRGVERE